MNNPAEIVAYNFLNQPNAVRRPANITRTSHVPVLAAFDPDNAVIWANEELGKIVEKGRRSLRVLRDEDTETLAHEFARALNYREVFQNHLTRSDRSAAIRKQRAQVIMRSTAESYANRRLMEERRAEEVAQQVRMEILSSFDKKEHGSGLTPNDLGTKARESAAGVVNTLRSNYRDCARREFARFHSAQHMPEVGASAKRPSGFKVAKR